MKDEFEKILTDREQQILDGELSSAAAAAEEGLPEASGAGARVAALVDMEQWLRDSRSEAPSSLHGRVLDTLQSTPARGVVLPLTARKRVRAGVMVMAAAAALFVAIRLNPGLVEVNPPASVTAEMPSEAVPNTVRYEFTLQASEAKEVCIAGNFNHWKVCETPLQRVGEDLWSVSVELPKGRHEYMFVVDGRWVSDPGAQGYAEDGFGNRNAVVQL